MCTTATFATTIFALFALLISAHAFQPDEVQAIQNVHDQLSANWRTKEFSLHVKDLLFSLISRKTQIAQQIQEQLRGPLEEIQRAEQEFMQVTQTGNSNQQVVDAKFQALTALQDKYDQQIYEQGRALQILGVESELAEDLLLRNFALESCLLRRDVMALRAKQQEPLSVQDLQDERRSLQLTQEEINGEQSLIGLAVVQAQEGYCGKRAGVLHQSLATLLTQIQQQQQQGASQPQQ